MKKILFIVLLFSFSIIFGQIPTNGLIGYWPLNGNTSDYSGNGNHGTANGVTLATDRFGNANMAYDFNGTSNYVEVLDNAMLRPNNITISVWINSFSTTTIKQIIYKGNYTDAYNEQYSVNLTVGSNNYPACGIKQNSGCNPGSGWVVCYNSTSTIPNFTWQHITMTYDGSFMNLYLNCNLMCSIIANGTIDNCPGSNLQFGRSWTGNPYFFDGLMDDIRIYNRALDTTEINMLCDETFNGISDLSAFSNTINVYPNPTNAYLYFNLDNNSGSDKNYNVKIINSLSQIICQSTINQQKNFIDLSAITCNGIYFIELYDSFENLVAVKKVSLE